MKSLPTATIVLFEGRREHSIVRVVRNSWRGAADSVSIAMYARNADGEAPLKFIAVKPDELEGVANALLAEAGKVAGTSETATSGRGWSLERR